MEIQKSIKISIRKKGKYVVCRTPMEQNMALGSSAVSSNLHMYSGVKKIGKDIHIPIKLIQERIEEIKTRIDRDILKIEIMKQIIK